MEPGYQHVNCAGSQFFSDIGGLRLKCYAVIDKHCDRPDRRIQSASLDG